MVFSVCAQRASGLACKILYNFSRSRLDDVKYRAGRWFRVAETNAAHTLQLSCIPHSPFCSCLHVSMRAPSLVLQHCICLAVSQRVFATSLSPPLALRTCCALARSPNLFALLQRGRLCERGNT